MKKSILFLGLVAFIAFSSCCGNSKSCSDEQTTTECSKGNVEKESFVAKWAQFETLVVEEQEAILEKRAEGFAKCKEVRDAKKAECKDKQEACKNKTEEEKAACQAKKQALAEIDAMWENYPNMTVAEKKAFFDKVDALMPAKHCEKEVKKECGKEEKKDCNGDKKSCGKNKDCDKAKGKDCCKQKA